MTMELAIGIRHQ